MPSLPLPEVSLQAILYPLQTKKKGHRKFTWLDTKIRARESGKWKQQDRKGVSHNYQKSVNLVNVNKLFSQIHYIARLTVQNCCQIKQNFGLTKFSEFTVCLSSIHHINLNFFFLSQNNCKYQENIKNDHQDANLVKSFIWVSKNLVNLV